MRLERELEAAVTAPREARALIRDQAVDVVPAPALADVLTVVSELIDNAVRHGEGESVRLRLEVRSDAVVGEVESRGRAGTELQDPSSSAPQGLGLLIVNAIAEEWGVEQRNGTLTAVRFEIGLT